ncbi:MAG TPA: metallophosphoesterase family protein [Verrucomicrobiales bacterium]|nr:metallophosphoesterase family protein [Verrucomicrobiales bacterium]
MTRPLRLLSASLITSLLAVLAWAQAPAPAPSPPPKQTPNTAITRGPYPQAAAPTAMHLVWRIRKNTMPVVHYGTAVGSLTQRSPVGSIVTRRLAAEGASTGGARALGSGPPETRQYEATITGLKPDTKYFYAIYDGPNRLTPPEESYSFRTLPQPGTDRPLLMWVVGDSGTGNKVQAKVHNAMRTWLEKEKRDLDMFIHVGDMAYGKGMDSEFQAYFFKPYETTLRNTICWPAIGNHEGGSSKSSTTIGPYYDSYVMPTKGESGGVASGTESYYSFDVGRVHFVALNSFDAPRAVDGVMAQWLKADLEKTKADWIIAFFHHPPYTKGSHDSDDKKKDKELVEMRENFMPILEGAGVDLVLAGHSHIYERSMLIDGAYATPTVAKDVVLDDGDGNPAGDGPYKKSAGSQPHQGSVSIVAGHGGTTLRRMKTVSPVMRTTLLEFGSVILDLKGDTLTGRMLNSDGIVRDTFQIVKQGKVQLTKIPSPKPPPQLTGLPTIPVPGPLISRGDSVDNGAAMPKAFVALIPKGADWQYLVGKAPETNWSASVAGGAADWKTGPAGFGYGDNDDATVLKEMRGKSKYMCIRREFEITGKEDLTHLGLAIAFDDGFICYLNGKEVVRDNVENSLGTAKGVKSHEAKGNFRYYAVRKGKEILKPGKNVIGIEIHNDDAGGSDLTLDPYLVIGDGTEEIPPPPPEDGKDPSDD